MIGGVGPVDHSSQRHVVLFAMHNLSEVPTTFRDSIRIQSLLRCTSVTHISSMNLHSAVPCVGHNQVHFGGPIYPVLMHNCPPIVIWDYNFVPGGYVVSNYKENIFSGQVPGFFYCGAHLVIMPNWVCRNPPHSSLDNRTRSEQSMPLLNGLGLSGCKNRVSFAQGLAEIAPRLDVKQIFLSAVEAETLHPLVVATIEAEDTLKHSRDPNATNARWSMNTCYIGEKEAFIVFYNAQKISCPRQYLVRSLSQHRYR